MRRRDFIKIVAGTAVTWPLVARAQQAAMPVIGLPIARGSHSLFLDSCAAHEGREPLERRG